MIRVFAWPGANAWLTTTATACLRAEWKNGSSWWKRPAFSRWQAVRGEGILPATRFAVDAYIQFVATHSHLESGRLFAH